MELRGSRAAPRVAALALLLPAAAAAQTDFPFDLQLYRLGHPEVLLGDPTQSGNPPEAGDPSAQTRFARLVSELGVAAVPRLLGPAESLGDAGFELSASFDLAFVNGGQVTAGRDGPSIWVVEGANPPNVLLVPTIRMRKGLPFSTEVGLNVGYVIFTQMVPATITFKAAVLEGFKFVPDVAVRGFATHVIGARDLDLTLGGLDVSVSKAFGIAGMFNLTPYLGWNSIWLHASTGPVDFRPSKESDDDPNMDDSVFYEIAFGRARFDRFFLGLRLVSYVLVFTAEGNFTLGKNPDGFPDTPSSYYVEQWSAAAKIGVDF